ncbi:MAG: cytosine deaminase [Prochlorococcus sp. SP3034]|nr:cytosine deaminase [Prochlorococcus sp. SP3034]
MNNSGSTKALIPRSLFKLRNDLKLDVNNEGFAALEIFWENGQVSEIIPSKINNTKIERILLPRFVEPHAHFDKSFTWLSFPNLKSNYENALSVNLEEHITRNSNRVIKRAEESLNLAIENGYRGIRTHIDTYYSQDQKIWPELFKLREKYFHLLSIQFVALAPLEFWSGKDGERLAINFRKSGDMIGGVVVPPLHEQKTIELLSNMILLASKYKLGIDLHIDESSEMPGLGIKILLKTIKNLKCKVPITCSHLSSISLLKKREIAKIGKEIAENNIKVIALPLTNFWLLNRDKNVLPITRPVAPIKQLQNAFVDVSVGSDNVQDPWYPFGNFDPFYLMALAMPMLQINPWDRLSLSALLTAPSRLLNLSWDGIIKKGCPADFVIAKGKSWSDLISGNVKKEVLIKGKLYSK